MCVEGVSARVDGDKPKLFSDKPWSGVSRGGEEGWDKRVRSQQEKSSQQERGPHPDWQSTLVSSGEPAQNKNNKEWVS